MSWDDEHIRNKYELDAIRDERTELWNQNADLRHENTKLNVEIAKLVGMSVTERAQYKSDIAEQLKDVEDQLRRAKLDAEKAQESYERRIKEGKNAYKKRMQELGAEIRRASSRLRDSQMAAIESEAVAKELDASLKAHTERVAAALRRASEDNNLLILKPAIWGVGIDLRIVYRRLRGLLKRRETR